MSSLDRESDLARQLSRRRRRRRPNPATAWSLIVIGFLIVIMFLPSLIEEITVYRRQSTAAALPSVTGEVIESRVLVEPRRSHSTSISRHTEPLIRYRYKVDGAMHESTRFTFQEFVLPETECEAIVERHPPGSAVTVHYVDDQPDQAVIDTRPAILNYPITILCSVMLLFGTGVTARGVLARPWELSGHESASSSDSQRRQQD